MSRATRHRRPRHRVEPATPALADLLARLAGLLEETAEEDGWGAAPALVRLRPVEGPGAFELGRRPIEADESPVSILCGFRAPADWHGIGVIAEGKVWSLDAPRPAQAPGRMRVVHLVHRSGLHASVLRRQGEAALAELSQPVGRIDDYCRRALGIATPPPSVPTLAYLTTLWLHRLLDAVPPTWGAAARLHPAAGLLEAEPALAAQCEPHTDLLHLGPAVAAQLSWEAMRAADVRGGGRLGARFAAWLDEGSYSREVLGDLPPFEHLAPAVLEALPVAVATHVGRVLEAWDLWPVCTGIGNT